MMEQASKQASKQAYNKQEDDIAFIMMVSRVVDHRPIELVTWVQRPTVNLE